MQRYIGRRLVQAAVALLLVTLLIFSMARVMPGDVTLVLFQEASGASSQRQVLRERLGLDEPFFKQYGVWLWGAATGDFGKSFYNDRPVVQAIGETLPITLELALLAALLSVAIALPVAVISAMKQDSLLDYALRSFSVIGLSLPNFWLGTLLIVLPAIWWNYASPINYTPFREDPVANMKLMLLPAIALGLSFSASLMRMGRSAILEVLRQDYVRTARAKGLREAVMVYRHVLKNALIPVVTLAGLQLARLLAGAVIVEMVFSLPGLGRLTLNSILQRDYPLLQGTVLVIASVVLLMNLLVDVVYGWLDPRITYA